MGVCWEYPLPLLIPNTAFHRSIAARLALYPLAILAAALLYQGTNAAIYYLVGLAMYFWAYSEGEVCNPIYRNNKTIQILTRSRLSACHGSFLSALDPEPTRHKSQTQPLDECIRICTTLLFINFSTPFERRKVLYHFSPNTIPLL